MLLIDKNGEGTTIKIEGDPVHILAELCLLVEIFEETTHGKMNVRESLCDPMQIMLTKQLSQAMKEAKGVDIQREYDGDEALLRSENTQTLILKTEDKESVYNADDFAKSNQTKE